MSNFRDYPQRDYPRLEGFERLQITDGLPITAERWQQAHGYHRHRQNFHYQALYQPGIVYGLGVTPVPDQPDGRLLQVQPGIAIDVQGNPIIVPRPEEFRIASDPPVGQTLLVYLVVSYVDPDTLRRTTAAKTVVETFRIVEKLHLGPEDVELCRIHIQSGATQIQAPTQVFAPALNQLDLRDRRFPQPHAQGMVQVGMVSDAPDPETQRGIRDLLRSLPGLYPVLQGLPTIPTWSPQSLGRMTTLDCHLLHLPYRLLPLLSQPALQSLKAYVAQGNVLLVVADFSDANLLTLLDIGRELRLGLAEAERDRDLLDQIGPQLQAEVQENQREIAQRLAEFQQPFAAIAQKLGGAPLPADAGAAANEGDPEDDHPLRCQPFLFSQLPTRLGHPIRVKNWGGVVLMVGDLCRSWGGDPRLEQPREVLRSAQEWGVNLLQFAVQRRHWMQLMQPPVGSGDDRPDSLQRRVSTS